MSEKAPSLLTIRVLTGVALAAAFCSMPWIGLWLDAKIGVHHFEYIFNVSGFVFLASCILYCAALLRRSHASVVRTAHLFKETSEARRAALVSEHKLTTFLNLGPDAFLNVSDDGVILAVNRYCCDLLGASDDVLIGNRFDAFLPDDLVAAVLKSTINPDTGSGPREVRTTRARRMNGDLFYAEIATTRCVLEGESMILCVIRDVSTTLDLQHKLQESQKNLRAVLENSAELLCALDTEHRLLIWNKQFEDEFVAVNGFKPTVGMVHYAYLDAASQEFWRSKIDRALDGRSEVFVRQYAVDADMHYAQISIRPIITNGKVVGVSGSVVNITERIKSEKRLQRSLERYEMVTKATNEVIWDWNIEKGKMYWGANYEKLFGYSLDQEETESGAWVQRVHEEDRERIIAAVHEALHDSNRHFWEDEYKYITAYGNTVLVHDKAYIVRDEHGKALHMIGAMDDVTEQRQVEQRLRDFNRELEHQVQQRTEELHAALAKERELSELKTRFMSMVSHEFRTPLTVILSSTELLHKYNDRLDAAQRNEYFNVIHHEIQRLVGMLTDVITLGKSTSGKLRLNSKPVVIEKFVDAVIARLYSVSAYRERIVVQNRMSRPTAVFDESLIQHSLSNLLANALKYSGADSPVTLHLEEAEHGVVLSVEDHGIGIPESDIQHLFEPFHRAANVGNVPGSGLGLTIVQEFVTMHNGTIEVSSVEGRGTTMTMFIPAEHSSWTSQVQRDDDRELRTTPATESKEHSRSYLIQHPMSDDGKVS